MRGKQLPDPPAPETRSAVEAFVGSVAADSLPDAAQLTGEATFDDLAGHAAWGTWEHATDSLTNICCGLGGLAYALLARYRATGDASWYRRAIALASRAARVSATDPPPHPDSLYHGTAGIALLIADLGRPQTAAMPFFGSEGWCWDTPRAP